MSKKYLLGVFRNEHDMIRAAQELKKSNITIFDIYTPFPVHGLDQYLDIKPTKLPVVTLIAGTLGLVLALLFQYWVSVIDWPINVGGKPFNSFIAFVPVAFEITILFGAFITVFAFLMRSKLMPLFSKGIMHTGATQDKFVIALEVQNAAFDTQGITKTLGSFGASEVSVREE